MVSVRARPIRIAAVILYVEPCAEPLLVLSLSALYPLAVVCTHAGHQTEVCPVSVLCALAFALLAFALLAFAFLAFTFA